MPRKVASDEQHRRRMAKARRGRPKAELTPAERERKREEWWKQNRPPAQR